MSWTAPCPRCGQTIKHWLVGNAPTHAHNQRNAHCPNVYNPGIPAEAVQAELAKKGRRA